MAHQLIALGVEPDQRVAICVTRSPAMVVGVLAVLKAGGAYVPLDPAYPSERLGQSLMDAAPAIVLADNLGRTTLGEQALAGRRIFDPNILPEQPDTNPQIAGLTSRHLAYVIYTSGSTGLPKGVAIEHRNAVNFLTWAKQAFSREELEHTLFSTSLNFDLAVYECFAPLISGGTVYLVADVLSLITTKQTVSLINTVPSAITHMIETDTIPTTIHTINLAGEALKPHIVEQLFARTEVQDVCNLYGPSETTTYSTWVRMNRSTGVTTHIGRPIANTQIYILDPHAEPAPIGVIGEIYIGGTSVARGYLNRPELTAKHFLPNPFDEEPEARMYKTGDLARWLPDGNIEYLGRNDQQVKIRGFRIEPGEIEVRLMEHPAVREAVVLALGEVQDKRLVAYVVAETAEADTGLVSNLRIHLSAVLPDYMVPAAFVRLEAFPLTPNGKLDRRALPAPDSEAFARQSYEAPQGEMETALAAIWRDVLGIEQISRHDNFFALGGHSLLAVRVMNRIAALGAELPLTELFISPSLIALAEAIQARIDSQHSTLPAIMPVSREGILPLSFAQQRLWFLAQLDDISETYHLSIALRLRGQLDIAAWQQALNALFARHEALRSVFVSVDGQPQVKLLATDNGLPLTQHDLRGYPDTETTLKQLCGEAASAPFELSRSPLIRAALIRLADDEYQFLLTQHHIVSDGWSVNILIRELNALYTACLAGQPDPLPPLMIQYPDYAVWQRQWFSAERIQVQSDYWRTMLADAPVLLDLPTDRPRPPVQSFTGQFLPINLDTELTGALKRLSEQQGCTLFMTLLSAWSVVLSRLSGQTDIIIGTPSAGRNRQEVEPLIGFFVNTLALRLAISGELTVAELLAQTKQTALAAQANQDLPFEQVVEIVQPPRRLAHTPLFQVMFAWQNNESTDWELPGLAVSPVEQAQDARDAQDIINIVKFDLELNLSEEGDRIVGALRYATALFDKPTIERHINYLHKVLQAMVGSSQRRLGEIDILLPAERRLLLETWNATDIVYPEQLCTHQLFELQAENTPDAPALMHEGQTLSYAELNVRANQLARQLIVLGVKPEQRVAICVTRSPIMVVALLAVLKAGGAYVPLDPAYPSGRLGQSLVDADPAIVLADHIGRTALGERALAGRTVLDPNTRVNQPDSNPQIAGLTSRHLAYVIYTSGSTGTPKGVMVEHRSVVNLALAQITRFNVDETSRILQFVSLGFDVSVSEIMTALSAGACLVIPDDSVRQDSHCFWHYLEKHAVTHACLTPALLRDGADLASLTVKPTLILGGETPSAVLLRALCERVTLFNDYGPTEVTVCAMAWRCPSDYSDTRVLIGRPTANTRGYLLNADGQPVPLGSVGELYIGGAGVARGYLNRPELTAERFLVDPFSNTPDARMYRTGDLARYLPDGNLEFLGRNDQQVKIRGFRIEPGEIEVRLMEHPVVNDAVVLTLGEGAEKRLVAYVVAQADTGLVNSLRDHLSTVLPDYMVPAAFVRLDSLPLSPNGKLDRRALPAPDDESFARQVYAAPQGENELVLAAIWCELLGIEQVSRYDSFFALGGHSLLAMRMIDLAATLGMVFTLNDLFQFPELAELAAKTSSNLMSQPQNSAISIRSAGTGLPLFFVPTGMGDHSYAFVLAQHLPPDYPIYTLPWPSISETPMSTMEEQAARMITLMKAVQPTGPYRMSGYSSGGVLAYVIAQQLLSAGEQVNFLGLIDTSAPHLLRKEVKQPKYHFFTRLAWRSGEEHSETLAELYQQIDVLNLVQFIEAAQELALYPANPCADVIAKRWEQIVRYGQIVADYEPPALAITLHQFYATEPVPGTSFVSDEKSESASIDPSLGWTEIIPETSLQLIAIPGNHVSLMEDNEHRIVLAEALNNLLTTSYGDNA
nr:non-ribosomal peptide synthetase [Xenorhabdus sp. Reich]